MIPEAAVEAAARAFFGTLAMSKWEDLGPVTREAYCDKSRAAIEAAAPHMLAGERAESFAQSLSRKSVESMERQWRVEQARALTPAEVEEWRKTCPYPEALGQ